MQAICRTRKRYALGQIQNEKTVEQQCVRKILTIRNAKKVTFGENIEKSQIGNHSFRPQNIIKLKAFSLTLILKNKSSAEFVSILLLQMFPKDKANTNEHIDCSHKQKKMNFLSFLHINQNIFYHITAYIFSMRYLTFSTMSRDSSSSLSRSSYSFSVVIILIASHWTMLKN